ncbi:hypothetical protein BH09PAT1_BH09PAT1_0120 [soil metagenome]
MFGNLATLAVVSILSVSGFASSLVTSHAKPRLVSPLPKIALKVTPQPTVTVTPSLISTPTPIPTATPTSLPTATPTPISTTNDLGTLFDTYSQKYGVDKELLKKIALCESGFNTNASFINYKGLFQFSEESWRITRNMMGEDINIDLRTNPVEAIKTAAYKISQSGEAAWPNCH